MKNKKMIINVKLVNNVVVQVQILAMVVPNK